MRIEHRLVIDTNLYVSALLNDRGVPNRLVQYAIDKTTLLFSFDTLLELYSVLMRPKFDRYVSRKDRSEHFRLIHQNATLVVPEKTFALSRDPDDNKFIDVAVAGNADFIVSGDRRDLLSLSESEGIRIISARDFLARFLSEL